MNEVLDAIKERSSTRGYQADELTKEELDAILNAAMMAPTAANKQEIHISAVKGQNPILTDIDNERIALAGISNPANNFYYDAPMVFFLSADRNFKWSHVDCGIAVENMALAAQGLGLGSLIIGCVKDAMSGDKKEAFARVLSFPDGYDFVIAIAIGKKATSKEPHEYDLAAHVTCL